MQKCIIFVLLEISLLNYYSFGLPDDTKLPVLESVMSDGLLSLSPFNPAERVWDEGKLQRRAPQELSARVVGGRHATKGELPYNVLILRPLAKSPQWCAGAIYNRDTIISAAHCFHIAKTKTRRDPNAFEIIAGEFQIGKNDGSEMKRSIKEVVSHPCYRAESVRYDISIVKLKTPLTYNAFVQPLPIAKPNSVHSGAVTIGGFGYVRERVAGDKIEPAGFSPIMKVATVNIVPRQYCVQMYKNIEMVVKIVRSKSVFCAEGQFEDGVTDDACQGDSGGPAVCLDVKKKKYLCGIVITGVGCGQPAYPGIYANVSHLSSWIVKNAGKADAPTQVY